MDRTQLISLLRKAREQRNTYIVVRVAMLLKGKGCATCLTDAEEAMVIQCLEQARNKDGTLGLEPGYEVARWLMVCRYLFPEKNIFHTEADQQLIQQACDSYCNDRILKQVASLVQMGNILNIPISIERLPPKKRRQVLKLAATLS